MNKIRRLESQNSLSNDELREIKDLQEDLKHFKELKEKRERNALQAPTLETN